MIEKTMSISSIIEQYPETRAVFVANGLDDLVDRKKLEKVGAFLTLESALKMKKKDLPAFMKMLSEQINSNHDSIDITLAEKENTQRDVIGLVPLPVRLQILETFEDFRFRLQKEEGLSIGSKFVAAQVGTDWVDEAYGRVEDPRMLPDIILSAGFDFFFAQPFMDRFIKSGVFGRVLPWTENKDFGPIGLQDPKSGYSIISVVPTVFVVDHAALAGRAAPRTWEDLLDSSYEKFITMPERSIDVHKSVLLTLYARFGEEGVRCLGRNTACQLHPAQMAKKTGSAIKDRPVVSVMPYFFARTIRKAEGISVIWPEDGAIVTPIYMLAKSDPKFCRADPHAVELAAELFLSRQMGISFTREYFPSLHPEVNNALPDEASFQWIGWKFLEGMDSGIILPQIYRLFDKETVITK